MPPGLAVTGVDAPLETGVLVDVRVRPEVGVLVAVRARPGVGVRPTEGRLAGGAMAAGAVMPRMPAAGRSDCAATTARPAAANECVLALELGLEEAVVGVAVLVGVAVRGVGDPDGARPPKLPFAAEPGRLEPCCPSAPPLAAAAPAPPHPAQVWSCYPQRHGPAFGAQRLGRW